MRVSFGRLVATILGLGAALTSACANDVNVPEASCSSCQASYTAADCESFGQVAGCKSSSLGSGSCASCSFKDCDRPPSCEAPDAGTSDASAMDAATDPRCADAPDGLFQELPPCEDYGTLSFNGDTSYVCNCSGASCPCGFECGSIDLTTGGTVSGVCAPPP